jgi:5'-methylthioadenosine phosphorylase
MEDHVKIAVIGGSGFYNMPEITDKTTVRVETPFGDPSGSIMIGTLKGHRVAFLARHGEAHTYSPTTVPYRANIYALKTLGVRYILAVSACGSLHEDYAPGHIALPDQLYDNTKSERGGRTFFDQGLVAHVGVAEPFCERVNDQLQAALQAAGATVHRGGTFITIEGPRFSTKGESEIFRAWGCKLIGMTTSPEAYLAREAEIAYSVIAHITDYDVWHDEEETVSADAVMQIVGQNVAKIKQAMLNLLDDFDADADDPAHHALANALTTRDQDAVPEAAMTNLQPIVGKYFTD